MRQWLDTALSVSVATVLASVALAKASDFGRFLLNVQGYRLVPPRLAKPVALAVIGGEMALSVGLLVTLWRPIAAVLGIILLFLLTIAMGIVLLQGRTGVECGCSLRPGGSPVSPGSIAHNAGLALVLILVDLLATPRCRLDARAAFGAGAAGLAVALLYLALESLAALPGLPRRMRHE